MIISVSTYNFVETVLSSDSTKSLVKKIFASDSSERFLRRWGGRSNRTDLTVLMSCGHKVEIVTVLMSYGHKVEIVPGHQNTKAKQ